MFVIIVHAHVKRDKLNDFVEATLDNARNSNKEAGVARFDVYQQAEDPTRFSLVEIYRSNEALEKHRTSDHYYRWRDAVADMMEEPRTRVEYKIIHSQMTGE
jgi:quinol monooxygenase YgiN